MTENLMETIVNLCKRRGFVYNSSDIYGGFKAAYDYGPLGIQLLNNIKSYWWNSMVKHRQDIVGIDSSIILAPQVWKASGHLDTFTDPLVECKKCNSRHRPDILDDPNVCPDCGAKGEMSEPKEFNLMFKTYVGPIEDESGVAYFRPETAQGIFINFLNVLNSSRQKPPFGIAQIGKSFRNEITTKNFIFRSREFEQMEMEYFIPPTQWSKWLDYWKEERFNWHLSLGVNPEKLRLRPHESDELSHYSDETYDVEYEFPWGWGELEGIAYRSDFDLSSHAKASGVDISYFDQTSNERYIPHVIEPALGLNRMALVLLVDAYSEEEINGEKRVVLKLDKKIAPIQIAVLPLSKKPELISVVDGIFDDLKQNYFVDVDITQSIGKRYRRQDEIGTPYCVTVDFDTLEDNSVTIRDRDTMSQDRVSIEKLKVYFEEKFKE